MGRTATADTAAHQGAVELPIAAFGPVAGAVTDTGHGALAASGALPLAAPAGARDVARSRAHLLMTTDPTSPLRGAGRRGAVDLQSVGANLPAGGAFSMSEMGDGAHAIAHAGEAVAVAYSSRDNDGAQEGDVLSI